MSDALFNWGPLIFAMGTVGSYMGVYHVGKRVGRREEQAERFSRMAMEEKRRRLQERFGSTES